MISSFFFYKTLLRVANVIKRLKIGRSSQSEVVSKRNLWSLGGPTIRKVITIHLNYALTQNFERV